MSGGAFFLRDGIHCDTGAKNITRKQAGNVRAHLVEYANTHSGGMHRIVSINRHCRTLIYIVLHELFDPDFVPNHVGSEITTGRSRSRELIAKSGDTIQITRFLTRYLSPTYNNSGINIC